MRRWWWTRWLRLIVAVSTWWQWEVAKCVDPQSLSVICGGAAATNVSDFIKNMNATFSDLRSQLSDEKRFATAQYANISQPVYGRAQCRNYMSQSDCLACYDAAVSVIRNCSDTNVTAAELNSDDCSLRYDDYEFFKESTDNGVECNNITSRSVAELTEFVAAGERLLSDLARATAKTKDYFAATKRGLGTGNSTIYGVAQCVETITEEHCAVCLSEARVSLQNCVSFSADDGRAWGAACFMRYTNNSFFDDQHVTNIQSLIGKNSTTAPIIGGVIAAAILLIISFALLWHMCAGNILGATELQQPKRYSYEDLKAATNGFSEEYKLGQGSFGAVYKVRENRGMLSWKQRCDIIFGIARGIAYLHENYHVTILHRDIKPSNILLDDEFQAKIADFGLARLLPESQSHVSTKFAGTLGYTAPEYAIHGHLSEKVDIYSFGIVILEVISGRKCSEIQMDDDSATTEYLAWKLYERGMHENLADEALEPDEYDVEDMKKMVEIGLLCVQSPPSSRPTMSQLILMILSDRSIGHERVLKRPSFSYGNVGIVVAENGSDATASITDFTGR
ncbi:hypothetical protein C2S51_026225 [Perilla frutescens var. frutescens]|nr:hypothetical protein C2S51_026225 [Perilla frutescens var. frutescens]